MSLKLIAAALMLAHPVVAAAQEPAAAPAPAVQASLDADSPIEALMADAATKAVLEKQFPGLGDHPAYAQFKVLSLRQLAPLSGGAVTEDKIAAFEAALKASR